MPEPPPAPTPERGGEVVVAVEPSTRPAIAAASSLERRLSAELEGRSATVLVARQGTGGTLVAPADAGDAAADARGRAPAARASALRALLEEADRRNASAAALVSAGDANDSLERIPLLLAPILDGGFDCVFPAYRREKLDGMLTTAIVYPLTRALYGRRLRQPAGGEVALSLGLARTLLADSDWRRDPAHAGSDAWLVAKVLSRGGRVCQAWLGRWPGTAAVPENASHALARIVGPVFQEMERHSDLWQRLEGSQAVPSVGDEGTVADGPVRAEIAPLAAALALGLRELPQVWGLVLPPAALFALRRAAAAEPLRIRDDLWARIVYDFAVAHTLRTLERQQLLRAMTPLYLGFVASFANEVRDLDGPATDARVEALCEAFEREKPYAISRWRWPDGFSP